MRQRSATMTAAMAVCLAALGCSAAAAATHGQAAAGRMPLSGTWGTAEEVPGSQALNLGHAAGLNAISCTSAGNCVGGGFYASGTVNRVTPVDQAFLVSQADGTWGNAEEVPGTGALNVGGGAEVTSVSCPAVDSCSAGGYYSDAPRHVQAFVVTQSSDGTWGTAEEVPGTAALDTGSPGAQLTSLSCGAVGDCSAGGFYTDSSGDQQAFLVSETDGTWGTAQEVPGTATLNAGGGYAEINSLSCASAGNCSAGGVYSTAAVDSVTTSQAFVVSETDGTWGNAKEVPGTSALNTGKYAATYTVSCASAGNCSAGGEYTNSALATEAFTVSEVNGTWQKAAEVPGIAALNQLGLAAVSSVSCASPGNCSAGGFYQDASFHSQAFVVDETNGIWGSAEQVPGTATLNVGAPGAVINTLSCGAVGDCSAGGYYTDATGSEQAFFVSETGGIWGSAEEVPGTVFPKATSRASTNAMSCPSAGNCSAGGTYTPKTHVQEAFVVTETGS